MDGDRELNRADLVLEGGGGKGIAHVGAITALAEAGYQFPRVAGASAGAIAADHTDGKAPRWPTFGVKLQARPDPGKLLNEFHATLGFAEALLQTVINGNDQVHLADPCVLQRTIFVDTAFVSSTNFQLSANVESELFRRGHDAATRFLESWDWDAYLQSPCATDPGRPRKAQAAQGGWGTA